MDPADWGPIADQAGVVALMILFVSGFVRGWWITGREAEQQRRDAIERLEELRDDRDYWRQAADRAGGLAESAVESAPAPERRRRTSNASR